MDNQPLQEQNFDKPVKLGKKPVKFGLSIAIVAICLVAVAVAIYWIKTEPTEENLTNVNVIKPNPDTAGWQTYWNEEYGFEFKYPNDWAITKASEGDLSEGKIVFLRSPEVQKLVDEKKIDPGYSYNLVISFWQNINNDFAKGGSWVGQRNYTNLDDYFTDKNAFKQKTGEIILDGKKAYEVIIGGAGANYGILIDNDGIYQLSFPAAWDKSKLGLIENQILSTFKFIDKNQIGWKIFNFEPILDYKPFSLMYPYNGIIKETKWPATKNLEFTINNKICSMTILMPAIGFEGEEGIIENEKTIINGKAWKTLVFRHQDDTIFYYGFYNPDDEYYVFSVDPTTLDSCLETYIQILSTFKFIN